MGVSVPWQPELDAVILCGERHDPVRDRGLQLLGGIPLAVRMRDRLRAQRLRADTVYASASSQHKDYSSLGFEPISDNFSGWPGPLAAIEAALSASDADCLLVLPCDIADLPIDMIEHLWRPLVMTKAPLSYAVMDGQPQRCLCMVSRSLLPQLRRRLHEGRGQLDEWLVEAGAVAVHFSEGAAFCPIATR